MHEITHNLIKRATDPKNEDEIQQSLDELLSHAMKYGLTEERARFIFGFSARMHSMVPYVMPDRLIKDNDEILIIPSSIAG